MRASAQAGVRPKAKPRAVPVQSPERPSIAAVIDSCALFACLTAKEREHLAEVSHMAFAERGDLIWLAGNPAQFAGVVAVGFVKLTRTNPYGDEIAVELLGPGQCFGAAAAVGDRVDALTAMATANTWYLKVPSSVLLDIHERNQAFREQISAKVLARLRGAHTMMARLCGSKPESRMAFVLLMLGESHGKPLNGGVSLDATLGMQMLAEMAGISVPMALQCVADWEAAGAVTASKAGITIKSFEPLYRSARMG